MQPPKIPDNEWSRLQALNALNLLDTEPDPVYDRITSITKFAFKVPICLVSLVDGHRQWFKSCIGLTARETGRDISFCGHAINNSSVFIVPNAAKDPRFSDNPLVTGDPNIRFYAGYPLSAPTGEKIGTLCIISDIPQTLSQEETKVLTELGHLVEEEIVRSVQVRDP